MPSINEYCEAIEDSGLLSKSQKSILKYIVSFDLARGVPSSSIIDYMQITKQAVNFSLKELLKRAFVVRKKDKVFIYTINQIKLSELLEDYRKKKELKLNWLFFVLSIDYLTYPIYTNF